MKSRFGEERAGKALEWFSNHILTSHTFSLRPKIINKLHFNEWTSSNAEAEHSALKSKGVDLGANGSLADVATKSISAGERRMGRKIKRQAKDISSTIIEDVQGSLIAEAVVDPCLNNIRQVIEAARYCVSKQIDNNTWFVAYLGNVDCPQEGKCHTTPRISRLRKVIMAEG